MSFITDFFTSSTSGIVSSIGDAIDKNATSDEERLILRNELAKITADIQSKADEFEAKVEQQVTDRHKTDMQSDNKLSKNIRPASLIYLLAVVSVLSITDGNLGTFTVGENYVQLFQALLTVAFGFYFSSRGIEKAVKAWKGTK